jgi:hypothetical protein
VYGLATVLTLSRTGVVALGAMLIYDAILRRRAWRLVLLGAFGGIAFLVVFQLRATASLDDVDRVVMWVAFFQHFDVATWTDRIVGAPLGRPLSVESVAMEYYVGRQTEPLGGTGVHPLNLHGFWPRFTASYGLAGLGFLGLWLSAVARRSRPSRPVLLLLLFQGLSMSVFYTSVAGVMTFIVLSTLLAQVTRSQAVTAHRMAKLEDS